MLVSKFLNICQTSLLRDISLVKENYNNFCKFYDKTNFYIICPDQQISEFRNNLNYSNINLINENSIISLEDFKKNLRDTKLDDEFSQKLNSRISWYYQQVLKLSFIIDFSIKYRENILIWDADTIILKKIKFFNEEKSISYGTLSEFHYPYFNTISSIFKKLPKNYISSLLQFSAVTPEEVDFLKENLNQYYNIENLNIPQWISKIVIKSIIEANKVYDGSMFSEYELIGISKILQHKNIKQKIMLTLRSRLDGKLNRNQLNLSKFFNFMHVTYEHSQHKKYSKDMLMRQQKWTRLFHILLKNVIKIIIYKLNQILFNTNGKN